MEQNLFKETNMPTKKTVPVAVPLESMRPTDVEWKKWREARNVRYWYAVMLSLQVQPTEKNRSVLSAHFPEVYEQYKHRLEVLLKRRRTRKSLRPVGEQVPSAEPRNEYVDLQAVAKFAVAVEWDASATFTKSVVPPAAAKTLDGLVSLAVSDVEFEKQVNAVSTGQKRTLVRYAALVRLLRMAIDSPAEFGRVREAALGKRTTVSMQSLGEAVTRAVATLANEAGKSRISSGFGKDKNADEIAFAERMVKTYF